ncbi:mitochondrial antiviral-signaling protein [Apus apus]|uniref:mitochondrial antiviral-signaling protein n=1 Tax=Apus apus TaxID=8895 RepID=UPI0021F8A5A7|nr:mitochondrial antiviral-signaling protein [Apus apus]XP_051473301.1 mitochondrial antiviral-signaling protein [Apus apus]
MGLAEDKVYDHILKNLSHFKNIRVGSLADSLSCLTDGDRDELHAREETRGSQATGYKFYQHLKCRQGWVPDLIRALRQNNAGHLADELQHVYDSWQTRPHRAVPTSVPPADRPISSISFQQPFPEPNPIPYAPLAAPPHQDLPIGGQDLPIGGPLPLQPSAATTTSTELDARAPVQESLPKTLEQESPQPSLPGSMVCDGVSGGHGREGHLSHSVKATQVAVGSPGAGRVAVPSAVPPEPGRAWPSRQQHPVCVDNGCFGNSNHLHRGASGLGLGRSLPPKEAGAARSPQQPRNEPQEDSYVSTESPPRLEEAALAQPPDSVPKKTAVSSSEHSEPPGSFVDVRSPLLIQQQFDVEQKQIRMLREHGGDGDTGMETATPVPIPPPRDTSPSCDTSAKLPVQEKELPKGDTASSTPSMLTKKKVLPALVDPLPAVAGTSEGTSGRMAPRVNSATTIWLPCSNKESDVELSKPGVLLSISGKSSEADGRCPGFQEHSRPSFELSNSLTFSSDPLMVSTDSSSSGEALSRASSACPTPVAPEDLGGDEAAGASRDSHPPPSWDSNSLGTHEVHVDHHPSTQLEAGSNLQDGADPLGNPPVSDSSRGHDTVTSVPPGDSNRPSLLYLLPAVGIAVISVFLVYTRWKK